MGEVCILVFGGMDTPDFGSCMPRREKAVSNTRTENMVNKQIYTVCTMSCARNVTTMHRVRA